MPFISLNPDKPIKLIIDSSMFDLLYDKYGPVIYGMVLKATNFDLEAAKKITARVFVELSLRYNHNIETTNISFPAIVLIVVRICQQHQCLELDIVTALGILPQRSNVVEKALCLKKTLI